MIAQGASFPVRLLLATLSLAALGLASVGVVAGQAGAAQGPVDLGTVGTFAVLAGSTVTNTGPSVVSGDLGVSPGSAVTGFAGPPNGTVVNGTIYVADAAAQAQLDLTTAYNNAAGQMTCTDETDKVLGQDIGTAATPLLPGVYCFSSSAQLTGDLHLSGAGVYVFQIGTTLTTAPGSRVVLNNNASACEIFWQVGTSATLDTTTQFAGTVMANASISVNNGAVIDGRLLARTGQVSLINDIITRPTCAITTTTTAPGATTTTAPGATTTAAPGATLPGATGTTLSTVTTTTVPGATTSNSPSTGATTTPAASLPRTGQSYTTTWIVGLVAIIVGFVLISVPWTAVGLSARTDWTSGF